MTIVMHKFFSMYLFLFITLYMFRAHRAHHQERQIVSIQPLVTVILCWWPWCVQVGRTCTHLGHQHRMTVTRGYIDTICLSWWWAWRARNMQRVINRNEYIEKNLCIMLVIYQESLHDARSTKCKTLYIVSWWASSAFIKNNRRNYCLYTCPEIKVVLYQRWSSCHPTLYKPRVFYETTRMGYTISYSKTASRTDLPHPEE